MNNTEIHDGIDDWMAGALCDALSPGEREAFERHLAECPHCRTLFEENQKMNTLLNNTLPELRPDHNFERRILEGFRKKTARNGFRLTHWLVRFTQSRPIQAACAVLLLAAMVKSGALLTGERFPGRLPGESRPIGMASRLSDSQMPVDVHKIKLPDSPALSESPATGKVGMVSIVKNGEATEESSVPMSVQAPSTPSAPAIAGFNDSRNEATDALSLSSNAYSSWGGTGALKRDGALSISGGATSTASPSSAPSTQSQQTATAPAAVGETRKLIRNANLEIETENFEKAADTIATIVGEEQGYIATQNSERGENGKRLGEIVVKVIPAKLDRFLLKLRALGDLKNQTLGVEDVTKAYFDTDARLRNSQRMEERLLDMLKKNTGRVSDLLQVERELARVREQIEQMQGQLKLYDTLTQYATVTVSLREKDLGKPAAYLLRERANLSLFAKDVEKTFADAKFAAEKVKAQTVESRIERDGNERVSATLRLLIAPEIADETISRLKTFGRIQNYNSQSERVARDGSGNSDTAKVERDKVELNLVISRDEEPAAQRTSIGVLSDRVEEKTAQIRQSAASAGVEVKNATFNRASNGMEVSSLALRMPMQKYAAFLEQIKALGSVKNFTVNRRDDNATENAPAEIALEIYSHGSIVADDTGLFATARGTLAQGFGALMWSARMIGVTLAFIAPWGLAFGAVAWLAFRRRGKK